MPFKSSKWCPGCKVAHRGGEQCLSKKGWSSGKSSGSGRGGRPWRRLRKRIFERDDYLCQEHLRQGVLVPVELHDVNAGVCDHIIPKSDGGTDDDGNLETICKACDKEKTQRESRKVRFG